MAPRAAAQWEEKKTDKKLTLLAALALLLHSAGAPAHAGSVTEPGETLGAAIGAPAPPGVYLVDTSNWGCRDTQPKETCEGVTIPLVVWSTPWKILGGRLQFALATLTGVEVGVQDTTYLSGWFNPYADIQLAWDLGHGWGFSALLGYYLAVDSPVAFSSDTINPRFALSYTGDHWDLTANVILGFQFDQVTSRPQASPCPVSPAFPHNGCNPDYINIDLTATKTFDKWELGPVAYYSSDLSTPVPGYLKQSQFAIGGFIGYEFGPAILQGYLTTDIYQKNYGGYDTRGWARIIIPVGNPFGPSSPVTPKIAY